MIIKDKLTIPSLVIGWGLILASINQEDKASRNNFFTIGFMGVVLAFVQEAVAILKHNKGKPFLERIKDIGLFRTEGWVYPYITLIGNCLISLLPEEKRWSVPMLLEPYPAYTTLALVLTFGITCNEHPAAARERNMFSRDEEPVLEI
jgi:hypothetical protein